MHVHDPKYIQSDIQCHTIKNPPCLSISEPQHNIGIKKRISKHEGEKNIMK